MNEIRIDKDKWEVELTAAVNAALPFAAWRVHVTESGIFYIHESYEVGQGIGYNKFMRPGAAPDPDRAVRTATKLCKGHRGWLGDAYRAHLAEKEAEELALAIAKPAAMRKGGRL